MNSLAHDPAAPLSSGRGACRRVSRRSLSGIEFRLVRASDRGEPQPAETVPVHARDHFRRLSVRVYRVAKPAVLELRPNWDLRDLHSLAPAEGNGAGERVVQEVDRVVRQAGTRPAVDRFVVVLPG